MSLPNHKDIGKNNTCTGCEMKWQKLQLIKTQFCKMYCDCSCLQTDLNKYKTSSHSNLKILISVPERRIKLITYDLISSERINLAEFCIWVKQLNLNFITLFLKKKLVADTCTAMTLIKKLRYKYMVWLYCPLIPFPVFWSRRTYILKRKCKTWNIHWYLLVLKYMYLPLQKS